MSAAAAEALPLFNSKTLQWFFKLKAKEITSQPQVTTAC